MNLLNANFGAGANDAAKERGSFGADVYHSFVGGFRGVKDHPQYEVGYGTDKMLVQ